MSHSTTWVKHVHPSASCLRVAGTRWRSQLERSSRCEGRAAWPRSRTMLYTVGARERAAFRISFSDDEPFSRSRSSDDSA
eukprot:6188931-Pleurochrysis_carterae.AAC.3